MNLDQYRTCILSLESILRFVFHDRWKLQDGSDDPLDVIYRTTGCRHDQLIRFGERAAELIDECRQELLKSKQCDALLLNLDDVIRLGTFLSMRSTESGDLGKHQDAAPVITSKGGYSHDSRIHRMLVLSSCWLALYFLGMRFDFMLAALKRLADRSQGYPNGFISLLFLGECVEDARYDFAVQDIHVDVYVVAATVPVLFSPWQGLDVSRLATVDWSRVSLASSGTDWTEFTHYLGWLYYFWQCTLLGSGFQNALDDDEEPGRITYCRLEDDKSNVNVGRKRLRRIFGPSKNVFDVTLANRTKQPVGVFHSRGGFTIGARESFGQSYEIVARRLDGTQLEEHLRRLTTDTVGRGTSLAL
jgi:hypothetical protein